VLVLDSGGVSALARPTEFTTAKLRRFRRAGLWPPRVPAVVLVECLHGRAGRDARVNMLLKLCELIDRVPESLARRAAALRTAAGRGSAVDALVVAFAEPGGTVLTGDPRDIAALASLASDVAVERV
jgi:hypothetical protein